MAPELVRTNCFKPGRDFLVTCETVPREGLLSAWEPTRNIRVDAGPPSQQHKVKLTFKAVFECIFIVSLRTANSKNKTFKTRQFFLLQIQNGLFILGDFHYQDLNGLTTKFHDSPTFSIHRNKKIPWLARQGELTRCVNPAWRAQVGGS